jgi:hypothetical protein
LILIRGPGNLVSVFIVGLAFFLAGLLTVRAAAASQLRPDGTPTPASVATPLATASPAPKVHRFSSDDYLRVYRFYNWYRTNTPDQSAENQAIALNVAYHDPRSGLGAGATYFNADPFGGNTGPPNSLDSTLPPYSLRTLGVACAEFQESGILVRGGRQIINEPWVSASDTRMVPATFNGILAQSPWLSGWQLSAARIFSWKNRTVNAFQTDNLFTNESTPGILFGILERKAGNFDISVGQYQFYDTAHLTTVEATQAWGIARLRPTISFQYASENEPGSAFAGTVASRLYGAKAKVFLGNVSITGAYDGAPFNVGTFQNGGPISPYVYATDSEIYTTSMINELDNNGAGSSYRFEVAGDFAHRHVKAFIAHATFLNTPPGAAAPKDSFETDLNGKYFFTPAPENGAYNGWAFQIIFGVSDTRVPPFRTSNVRFQLEYTTNS